MNDFLTILYSKLFQEGANKEGKATADKWLVVVNEKKDMLTELIEDYLSIALGRAWKMDDFFTTLYREFFQAQQNKLALSGESGPAASKRRQVECEKSLLLSKLIEQYMVHLGIKME